MAQMDPDEAKARDINRLTETIIGCAFRVGKTLGAGFLEKVYENALAHELKKAGLLVDQQARLVVWYDGVEVGVYTPDLFVQSMIVVEVKAARALDDAHQAQGLNYLAATKMPICLLLNFATRVQVKRIIGPAAPHFPSLHLGSSGSSVASSSSPAPATYAEQAEWDDP